MDFARTKYGTVDACGERLPTNYGPQTVSNFATSGSYATEKECQSTNGKVEPTSENKRNSELGQMSFVNHVLDNSSTATERTMNECPKFACVHCGTAQVNQEALEEHFKTCTANNNNTTETPTDPTEDNNSQDAGLKQGHMCMECGEVLSNSYSLKRHSLIHSGGRPHKCEYCDKRYPHAYLLMHHLNTHAGDRPYRCTECGKDFTSPNTLRRHRGVHRKQTYQCYLCDQQFQRIDFLDRHLAKEHDVSKQHLCLVCGKSFTFENMLQEHIESHNKTPEISEKDLKCNLCDNTFSRMSSLNRHKKQMHNCDTEDKSVYFQSPQFKAESDKERDEKENKKTPNKDAVVVCKLCGKSFSRADSLKRHTIGVHENSKNSNEPYEPMLTFPESRSVVQNQHKERNHPCEQCGMQFTTDELLLRHKAVVHPSDNKMEAELLLSLLDRIAREKDNTLKSTAEGTTVSGGGNCSQQSVKYEGANIYCTGCKTNFPDANSLEIHMSACMPQSKSEGQMGQTEVAANPAQAAVPRKEGATQRRASPGGRSGRGRVRCQECGKQFADNYCLKRHMISHTGEKKHTCDICGKKFAHSFHLTTHKKIHLGKRDFRCEICGKTFTVNHALQRHLLTHPSTVVHACIYCDRKFANETSMQKHQLTHIK